MSQTDSVGRVKKVTIILPAKRKPPVVDAEPTPELSDQPLVAKGYMSRWERARLLLSEFEQSPAANSRRARGETMRKIAATLGISPRQVRKYAVVLRGPVELLQAVDSGRLKVSHALDVLALPAEQAEPILAVLRDEPDNRGVKAMVQEAVAGDQGNKKSKPGVLLAKLVKVSDELIKHENTLGKIVTDDQRSIIVNLRRLLEALEGNGPAA